jgi:hypothetical protein
MPRFFFHLRDDLDVPDDEGTELPDVESARQQALQDARSLMCETLATSGRIALDHTIDIEDGEGTVLDTVVFRDALSIDGK